MLKRHFLWTKSHDPLFLRWKKLVLKFCSLHKYVKIKVKLTTVVKGNQKAPFSIATKQKCRGGRYSFPWIAPLSPRYVPYIAEH